MTPTPNPFDPALHGGVKFDHSAPVASFLQGDPGWAYQPRPADPSSPQGCVMCGTSRLVRGTRPAAVAAPRGPFMLPQPESVIWQKIEVHTLRFGAPEWLPECAPTLDAWCARHGLPLHVTSAWDPAYPDPKFCEVDMLRAFLAGDSEWMLYVDADVVVHPLAPRIGFPRPGFWIREDTHGAGNVRWFDWCRKHFGSVPSRDHLYRNAGVWACDRESAARMLGVITTPYHEGIMEQDQWNWWIQLATAGGMRLETLPHEWNRFPREVVPSWFFHIYSKAKIRHLLRFRQAGLLPDAVKRLDAPPPVPDFGAGAVVWPWLSTAAEWDELWFSHRSVCRHWSEKDWPHVLLADHKPDWWTGGYIHAPDYATALWLGTQCADRVLWMNDDILMLADQSPSILATAVHQGDAAARIGEYMVSGNVWRRGLGQVLMRLHHHGKSTLDFSTHTPYLYEREKAGEVLEVFGQFWKIPFETAYHNWHGTPSAPCLLKAPGPHALDGRRWINIRHNQVTPEFRVEMARRFGAPPR